MTEGERIKKTASGKAIILVDGFEKGEYEVFEQNENNGPWNEGSIFRQPHPHEQKPVDNHFFVYHRYVDGNGNYSLSLVGVAHSEPELSDKVYECAVEYCKKRAGSINGEFIDQTSRSKPSVLEMA